MKSWGMRSFDKVEVFRMESSDNLLPSTPYNLLPFGSGRSYGDVCLNDGQALLLTCNLDKILDFDAMNGIIVAESGVSIGSIISRISSLGWFLPVTPGTKEVTVGGAIANDVHGKNHFSEGTFGCHVISLGILNSSGNRITCSQSANRDLFLATIGGIGLTGLILWAKIKLKRVSSQTLCLETVPFKGLQEYAILAKESVGKYEYSVAWLDCLSTGRNSKRGLFYRANFSSDSTQNSKTKSSNISLPEWFPGLMVKPLIKTISSAYFHYSKLQKKEKVVTIDNFFYPLDAVSNWNRIHGVSGVTQLQCLFQGSTAVGNLETLTTKIAESGEASFVSVLKSFGPINSLGHLSFAHEGITLAVDFPNHGLKTTALLQKLNSLVIDAGGKIYLAKDSTMSPAQFKKSYPKWSQFSQLKDAKFNSNLWRRVMHV